MEGGADRRELSRRERWAENFAKTRFGGWTAVNVANRLDRGLMPLTKNRVSIYRLMNPRMTIGLLTATGARSGQERNTPLLYLPDGDRIVVIASKAGAAGHPAWYFNVKANPEVTFVSNNSPDSLPYTAREAEGDERDQLWKRVNDLYAGYDTYQGRTERKIPVIVLDPR